MWTRSGIRGALHPTPAEAFGRGCGWPEGFAFRIPKDWRSGYYAVTLRADDPAGPLEWDHFFVVRAPARKRAKILMVLSTNTYAAYNTWGGKCLYASDDRSVACRLSFQRPWQRGLLRRVPSTIRNTNTGTPGFGERPLFDAFPRHVRQGYHHWTRFAGFHTWESIFVPWLEASGYTLDYCVQGDLDRDPGVVEGYRMLTSAGHDEYWTWQERDVVDDFVAAGGHAAFFIGNAAFWQVRLERSGQEMVCYKYVPEFDPVYGTAQEKYLTGMWSNPRTGRPENETFGLSFTRGGYHRLGYVMPRSSGGYMVYRPGHWVFAGTQLEYGDVFGDRDRIVGYECDGLDFVTRHGLPYPTGRDGAPAEHRDPGPGARVAGRAAVRRAGRDVGPARPGGGRTPARGEGHAGGPREVPVRHRGAWSRSAGGRGRSSTVARPNGRTACRATTCSSSASHATSSTASPAR